MPEEHRILPGASVEASKGTLRSHTGPYLPAVVCASRPRGDAAENGACYCMPAVYSDAGKGGAVIGV